MTQKGDTTKQKEFFHKLFELAKQYGVKDLGACGCCGGTGVDFEDGGAYIGLEIGPDWQGNKEFRMKYVG